MINLILKRLNVCPPLIRLNRFTPIKRFEISRAVVKIFNNLFVILLDIWLKIV